MVKKLLAANFFLTSVLLAQAVWANFSMIRFAAQSVLSSLQVTATNPTVGNDVNYRRGIDFTCSSDGAGAQLATTFSTEACLNISQNSSNGQNVFGAGTNAKTTYAPLRIAATNYAAGQRFIQTSDQTCYGMGDCFLESKQLHYAGGNIAGDEGNGFQSVSYLSQQESLTLTTITSVPAVTTCNTTLTQSVVGTYTAQSVSVASNTGCNVNDWVVIEQGVASASTNKEAVQITAVSAGHITAIFRNNHNSATTVTPAKVLILNDASTFGQQRVLVNLSGTSYSTGTVSNISGGGFTGSGTTWANNVVGGTASNIGCVQLTADNYSGAPFNGSGTTGTLKSWYQITSVSSATALGIYTNSTAGDASYHGKGPGAGGYAIQPCIEVLYVSGSTVVGESTSTTWTAGNSVELVIAPYPDVQAYQYQIKNWTPGGAGVRSFLTVTNTGARTISAGINISHNMATGSNADSAAYDTGVAVTNANTGLYLAHSNTQALLLEAVFGGGATDNAGKIQWNSTGAYISPNSTNEGMDLQLTMSGAGGLLSSLSASKVGSGSRPLLNFTGMLGTTPVAFSALPTCAAGVAGAMIGITDSSTATFNATITGGGANKGIAYCNGTNWTFH